MRFTELERSVRALAPLLSEARKKRIAEVVGSRTGSLAVLLENAWDEGNRNAVMRSMDAFGVHTLHTINSGRGKVERARRKSGGSEMRTDGGARNWIVKRDWSDVETCIRGLKREGFSIASTAPDADKALPEVDFSKRLVIAFGNEHSGVSDSLLEASDVHFSIPMSGFVESLNLSVSVAVTLYQAHSQRLVGDEAIRAGTTP